MSNTIRDVGSLSIDEVIPDFIHMSGDINVGSIGISSNLSVRGDLTVGENADIGNNLAVKNAIYVGVNEDEDGTIVLGKDNVISGGINNLIMGHENVFFGKESASIGNEGNKVGAKAFYWKAIDTTNKKIYLTKTLPVYNKAPNEDANGKINNVTRFKGSSTNYYSKDEYKKYDVPYFGPTDDAETYREISGLLTPENGISGINLAGVTNNTPITIYNTDYTRYVRCYKVTGIENGSVITYEKITSSIPVLSDETTRFKYNKEKKYNPNYYTLYFPDMVQSNISCNNDAYVVHSTFGNLAVGDSNTTMGNNSIAMGKDNRATGNYSVAIGYGN